MGHDPYSRVFRPDFQADSSLPQWVPMGEDDQGEQAGQATGSFVDLLKKRMAGGGGGSKGGAMAGAEGKAMGGGEGGGMQSL